MLFCSYGKARLPYEAGTSAAHTHFFKLGEKNDFIFISLAQILKIAIASNPNIWTKCSGIQQW